MAINEFSLKPTLDLDFSNEKNLNKSLKAKKILGNVEINNIVNNIKDNDFTINVVIKYLLEQISSLKEELNKIKSNTNVTNDLETKKQQSKEKLNELTNLLKDCTECSTIQKTQIKKLDDKIHALLEKYPSGVGSMFRIKATHLDQVEMTNLTSQKYDLINFLKKEYICEIHKNLSDELKKIINFLKSLKK